MSRKKETGKTSRGQEEAFRTEEEPLEKEQDSKLTNHGSNGEQEIMTGDDAKAVAQEKTEFSDLPPSFCEPFPRTAQPFDLSFGEAACDHDRATSSGTLEEEAMRFFSRADVGDNASTKKNTSSASGSSLAEQLHDALGLVKEHRNAYLQVMAEMQNFRKRSDRDNQQSRQFAIEGFARDLLLVADNLERALAAMPEEGSAEFKAMQDGVALIQSELNRAFEKHGVTRIKALKEPFDPHLHQAVMHVEDALAQVGDVVQEMQAGYLLNGRLLRPAMVAVAKGVD